MSIIIHNFHKRNHEIFVRTLLQYFHLALKKKKSQILYKQWAEQILNEIANPLIKIPTAG